MIFHDYFGSSPELRAMLAPHPYQVIEFPFYLVPGIDRAFTNGEVKQGPRYTPADPEVAEYVKIEGLAPKDENGKLILDWAKPPFEFMVLCGRDTQAMLLAHSFFEEQAGWEWHCILNLLTKVKGRVVCISVAGMHAKRGEDGRLRIANPTQFEEQADNLRKVINERLLPEFGDWEKKGGKLDPESERLLVDSKHVPENTSTSMMVLSTVVGFSLMNCRNIRTKEVHPSRQVRRAAERAGLPAWSHHVLEIGMGRGGAGGGSGATGAGSPLARHWVRGHFKDYTEKGLGRHKARGVYWWGPHLAGKADRVVDKDYKVVE